MTPGHDKNVQQFWEDSESGRATRWRVQRGVSGTMFTMVEGEGEGGEESTIFLESQVFCLKL